MRQSIGFDIYLVPERTIYETFTSSGWKWSLVLGMKKKTKFDNLWKKKLKKHHNFNTKKYCLFACEFVDKIQQKQQHHHEKVVNCVFQLLVRLSTLFFLVALELNYELSFNKYTSVLLCTFYKTVDTFFFFN